MGSFSLAQRLLCRTGAVFLEACPRLGQSILFEVKPPTGEPCAGDPHARFGGEGDREFNRSSLPLSGLHGESMAPGVDVRDGVLDLRRLFAILPPIGRFLLEIGRRRLRPRGLRAGH